MLAPLTKITFSKVEFKWNKIKQYGFEEIKRIYTRNNLLVYLDFNKLFKIHTNDSDFKLGAGISQKYKPIYYLGRKLTNDQKSYTVTEKDLLSIVETLK